MDGWMDGWMLASTCASLVHRGKCERASERLEVVIQSIQLKSGCICSHPPPPPPPPPPIGAAVPITHKLTIPLERCKIVESLSVKTQCHALY